MSKFELFPYLRSKIDKTHSFPDSSYKKFYDENMHLFAGAPSLKKFDNIMDGFSLIKASIVLEGLSNKTKIETAASLYQEANLSSASSYSAIHERLPYYELPDGKRIYVPFFTEVFNRPYDKRLKSLLKPPFVILKNDFDSETIDPFFHYGYDLFDSKFTDLIKVAVSSKKDLAAFYSIDLETVFVITDQGTLEETIPLFDTPLIDRRKDHLFSRLEILMDFYFDSDKDSFIDSLFNLHFITQKTYQYIIDHEDRKEN
jgi:hypothetical protein